MIIIKIINNMIKPVREHSYLNQGYRTSRIYGDQSQQLQPYKDTFQYDFKVFQQSLNIHKTRANQQAYLRHSQIQNSIKLRDNTNSYAQYSNVIQAPNYREAKSNFNRTTNVDSNLQFVRKEQFRNQNPHLSNIHQTKLSIKPKMQQIQNKQNLIMHQPQMIKQTKIYQNQNIENTQRQDNNKLLKEQEVMKQTYQRKIKQLEERNQQSLKKIQNLQQKLKEKQQIALRVEQIQKKLNQLYEENQQLHKINESLSKSRFSSYQQEQIKQEIAIQTDNFAVFVQDSFCQTRSFQLHLDCSKKTEEWLNNETEKARNWKIEYQREKISSLNKEVQLKAIIENIKIQHRYQIQKLQKQQQTLKVRYDTKCQQVKQKEGLINKYCVNKL